MLLVFGVEVLDLVEWEWLDAVGRALNGSWLIDRDAVVWVKMLALVWVYVWFCAVVFAVELTAFAVWWVDWGEDLERFVIYCTLVEIYGVVWTCWFVVLWWFDGFVVVAVVVVEVFCVVFYVWC